MSQVKFPLNAEQIFVEWATCEGGIGAIAFTDERPIPFIGLYGLNRMGKPDGLPCWFQRERLMSNVMIGYRKHTPLLVYIDVEISLRGISLIIHVPRTTSISPYQRHIFAAWGSDRPRYGFTAIPTQNYWPLYSFPEEDLFPSREAQ